jgi:general secretion pathway protein M
MSPNTPWQAAQKSASQAWRQAWDARSPREKTLLRAAAFLLAVVVVWQWAWAPAWRTWQEATTRQAALDSQTQRMLQWQAQAKGLQKPSTISRAEATQWLEKNLADLGPNAKLSLTGDDVTLRVEAAPALAMARWLSQAREHAQTLPHQAQMQQAQTQQANSAAPNEVLWQGTLVLRLP